MEEAKVLKIEDMTPDNYFEYLQFFFGPDQVEKIA